VKSMDIYEQLQNIHQRPELFSLYTADLLWTTPHLMEQMLQTHLNQETSLASRPFEAIDRFVAWLEGRVLLQGRAVCDLGCGPGLYTQRYAQRGAQVCGLDFSSNSIAYAKAASLEAGQSIQYHLANYLTDPLPQDQDVITMIFCDLCPLSPPQRQSLLQKIRASLKPNGLFVFDVVADQAFQALSEQSHFGRRYMGGFWAATDYFAFHNSYLYKAERVSLDHYVIVEEERSWEVYNWMQYFTPETIAKDLKESGFKEVEFVQGFGVDPKDDMTFGVVAQV